MRWLLRHLQLSLDCLPSGHSMWAVLICSESTFTTLQGTVWNSLIGSVTWVVEAALFASFDCKTQLNSISHDCVHAPTSIAGYLFYLSGWPVDSRYQGNKPDRYFFNEVLYSNIYHRHGMLSLSELKILILLLEPYSISYLTHWVLNRYFCPKSSWSGIKTQHSGAMVPLDLNH